MPFVPPVEDSSRPHRHRYPALSIRLCIVLVIGLHLSSRAAAGVLALFAAWATCGKPCFSTVRLWLCRLGLFLLRRVLAPVAGGWTLIIDHTVQMGQHKCFVVLGLPAASLTQTGFTPDCSDVTVLAVEVMDNATGEKVHSVLQQVQTCVGTIAQVVRDNASELSNGVQLLQQDDPNIVSSYDVRHLLACLLKARLGNCERWKAFIGHCGQSLPKLRQTSGNFLAPPTLRLKARYMNLDTHVGWASQLLSWHEKADWEALGAALGKASAEESRTWFDEKLGWLVEFRQDVKRWQGMLTVANLALSEVQQNGLSRQTAGRFYCRWKAERQRWASWAEEELALAIDEALAEEGKKIPEGKTLLGSSDVIESLLGKYKELAGKSPQGELGASVLLLPLLGAELSNEEIKEGLETVSAAEMRRWLKEELGESPRSKKRRLLGAPPKQTAPSDGPKAA